MCSLSSRRHTEPQDEYALPSLMNMRCPVCGLRLVPSMRKTEADAWQQLYGGPPPAGFGVLPRGGGASAQQYDHH
jgi:hypothetical protein